MVEPIKHVLAGGAGVLVGFALALVGGGGSILAVPLMIYLVGVSPPHVAIGTSALAVAVNAVTGLVSHARAGTVKWRCGSMFAAAGVAGAVAGSTLGKALDADRLLFLFALLMIAVGVLMLRKRGKPETPEVRCDRTNAPKVIGFGIGAGAFAGFFGIGGGFLVVPGLIASTGMPMINAVGTSLIAVAAFGLATALNYAASGLVAWPLAMWFIAGGVLGGIAGSALAARLAARDVLRPLFALLIFAIAAYMLWRTALAPGG